jgi:hypothetical protein
MGHRSRRHVLAVPVVRQSTYGISRTAEVFKLPQYQGIKCYAVVSGRCSLALEGLSDTWNMEAGDWFLLPSGKPFRLASDLTVAPVDFHALIAGAKTGGVITHNRGGSCFLIGGYFVLDSSHADMLLNTLPPVVHIRREADRGGLRWSLEQMREEARDQQPGWSLVSQHLAYTMLIRALRLHLDARFDKGIGWLSAIADKQLGLAMNAMHAACSPLDAASAWGARRYVANGLCVAFQGNSRIVTDGISDALAHVAGRR